MNVFSEICFIDPTDWMTLLEAPLENNDLPRIKKKKVCDVKDGGGEVGWHVLTRGKSSTTVSLKWKPGGLISDTASIVCISIHSIV